MLLSTVTTTRKIFSRSAVLIVNPEKGSRRSCNRAGAGLSSSGLASRRRKGPARASRRRQQPGVVLHRRPRRNQEGRRDRGGRQEGEEGRSSGEGEGAKRALEETTRRRKKRRKRSPRSPAKMKATTEPKRRTLCEPKRKRTRRTRTRTLPRRTAPRGSTLGLLLSGSPGATDDAARSMLPDDAWEAITPELYVTFWAGSLYDLDVPTARYDAETNACEAKIKALNQSEDAADGGGGSRGGGRAGRPKDASSSSAAVAASAKEYEAGARAPRGKTRAWSRSATRRRRGRRSNPRGLSAAKSRFFADPSPGQNAGHREAFAALRLPPPRALARGGDVLRAIFRAAARDGRSRVQHRALPQPDLLAEFGSAHLHPHRVRGEQAGADWATPCV